MLHGKWGNLSVCENSEERIEYTTIGAMGENELSSPFRGISVDLIFEGMTVARWFGLSRAILED